MSFRKLVCVSLCMVFGASVFAGNLSAQERERVVPNEQAAPPKTESAPTKRPPLTNTIEVVQPPKPLVTKTSSSRPTAAAPAAAASKSSGFSAVLRSRILSSIQSKLGIPYRYGSTGPNTYDCSGLVWTVFSESGIEFERSSARTFWSEFESVEGDDRYQFGTLVFFNGLGHIGIVVDKNGFYHASSSKGVTYSKFEGYWEKRIVGFKRVPIEKYLY